MLVMPGLILQVGKEKNSKQHLDKIFYGLTVSKKIGSAVKRNRTKRRLRSLAKEILPESAAPGYDYVLIARQETFSAPYNMLKHSLITALKRLGVWQEKKNEA